MASYKAIVAAAAVVGVLFISGTKFTSGQTQQTQQKVLLTWQAQSYTPPQFSGKVLPTLNSKINASLEVVDKGKLVDLSKQTIYWYLDDQLLGGGAGIQTVSLVIPGEYTGIMELSVRLPDFQGDVFMKSADITVVKPEAVIEAPYPDGKFGSSPIKVKGVPYFFNVTTPSVLNFNWNVNGEVPPNAENPVELVINLNPDAPYGSNLNVGLNIRNPNYDLTSAFGGVNLTFTK